MARGPGCHWGRHALAHMYSAALVPAELPPFSLYSQSPLACSINSQLVLVSSIVTSKTSLRHSRAPAPFCQDRQPRIPPLGREILVREKAPIPSGEACESPGLCFFWSTEKISVSGMRSLEPMLILLPPNARPLELMCWPHSPTCQVSAKLSSIQPVYPANDTAAHLGHEGVSLLQLSSIPLRSFCQANKAVTA